jgi:hypothetical protein
MNSNKLTYVIVNSTGEQKWVKDTYVQAYPKLYTPVQFKGIKLQAEVKDIYSPR